VKKGIVCCAIATLFSMVAIAAPPSSLPTTGVPIPQQIVALSEAVTPQQYAATIAAIRKEMAKPDSHELEEPGLGELKWIEIAKVPLGTIGNGFMVNFGHSPSCGNGGCPMWLLLPGPNGFQVAIKAGGWGFSVVRSGGSVPDIAFYWQMGAGETDVAQFHYAHGKFVGAPSEPAECGGEEDMRGVCAERSRWSQAIVWSIAPAEYESLARAMQRESASSRASVQFGQAHAIDFPLIGDTHVRVVGTGRCTPESNCTISIYGCKQTYPHSTSDNPVETNLPECEYWPMLRGVSGWGVANASDLTSDDPFSTRVSFVIAHTLSATEVELRRYSAMTQATGPQPGSTLLPDSCRIVISKTGKWPTHWDPNALTARTTPCTQR
jgi:hypothetical protein